MTLCSETVLFTMDLFDIFKFMRFLQNKSLTMTTY